MIDHIFLGFKLFKNVELFAFEDNEITLLPLRCKLIRIFACFIFVFIFLSELDVEIFYYNNGNELNSGDISNCNIFFVIYFTMNFG